MSATNDPVTGRRIVDPSVYSVEFKPRAGGRRLMGLFVFAGLAATGYVGWLAYQDQTTISYGIAATVAALTIVFWAAWASTPVSHLHVHGGVLEAQRAGQTERFDLTSHYTVIRVQGTARSSRWKVLIDRPQKAPFVIDKTMVDPKAFMQVLQAYHHGV
ncbi:MAG: hypothetical protein ABIO16_17865 [Nocardioides sp.]